MNPRQLTIRYALFAVLATALNLASQRVVLLWNSESPGFIAAVLVGTAVGLVVKYILDKRWIFFDDASGLKNHSKKFSLYTLMGVFTTFIFWGFESTFWFIWQTNLMRELGAIIGLAIGYVVKYNLDRRYVFTVITANQGSS